jgi:hypothetical protein
MASENLGSYHDDLVSLITPRFRFIGAATTGIP